MPNKSEIKERARLIRAATPNILEDLYEMQNRRCDLCSHPIQDLICAALDHSTPVIHFARSDMPITEAIAQANDLTNLRAAHASCNIAKNGQTREEWYRRGLNERVKPRCLTDGELLALSLRLGAGGRISGRMRGRQNVESGHLEQTRNLPQAKVAQRLVGRKAVESGQLASARSKNAAVQGGRIGGRKAAITNLKNGTAVHAPGMAAKGGRRGAPIMLHNRWHVAREIFNPDCELCRVRRAS